MGRTSGRRVIRDMYADTQRSNRIQSEGNGRTTYQLNFISARNVLYLETGAATGGDTSLREYGIKTSFMLVLCACKESSLTPRNITRGTQASKQKQLAVPAWGFGRAVRHGRPHSGEW